MRIIIIPVLVFIILWIIAFSANKTVPPKAPIVIKKEHVSLPGKEDVCILYISETEYVIGYCSCKVGQSIKKGEYLRMRRPNAY